MTRSRDNRILGAVLSPVARKTDSASDNKIPGTHQLSRVKYSTLMVNLFHAFAPLFYRTAGCKCIYIFISFPSRISSDSRLLVVFSMAPRAKSMFRLQWDVNAVLCINVFVL